MAELGSQISEACQVGQKVSTDSFMVYTSLLAAQKPLLKSKKGYKKDKYMQTPPLLSGCSDIRGGVSPRSIENL